jgi:hypothetical protein
LTGFIISACLDQLARRSKDLQALLIAYLAHIISLTIFFRTGDTIIFPIDGQEIGLFDIIERKHLRRAANGKYINDTAAINNFYERVGYCCQAIGSLLLCFLLFTSEEETYDIKMSIQRAFIFLFLLNSLNIILYYFLLQKG